MKNNEYNYEKEVNSLYEKIKEEQELYGTTETNPLDKFKAVLFLLYFFGSIALMIFLSSKELVHYCLITFGQLFFVFGMIAIVNIKKQDKKEPMLYIFPIVGGALVIIPLLMLFPNLVPMSIDWEVVIPFLVIGLFVAVGLGFLIIPNVREKKLKHVCTENVIATITEIKDMRDDGTIVYCPVYTFEFSNKTYNISPNYYTNVGIPELGTTIELKIDPMDPNVFIDPNKKNKIFIKIFGLIWVLFTLPIFIYMLIEMIKRGF